MIINKTFFEKLDLKYAAWPCDEIVKKLKEIWS
jgi:hypothetical protein